MTALEQRHAVLRRRAEIVEKLTFIRQVVSEVAFIAGIGMFVAALAWFLIVLGGQL